MSTIKQEASRCLKCKKPLCSEHCPVGTDIPRVMDLFLEGNLEKAGEVLARNNPLTAVTAIICPHERNCSGHCVLGKKGMPVEFYRIEQYISKFFLETIKIPEIKKNGIKVAVAGAGPAGITMAFLRSGFLKIFWICIRISFMISEHICVLTPAWETASGSSIFSPTDIRRYSWRSEQAVPINSDYWVRPWDMCTLQLII